MAESGVPGAVRMRAGRGWRAALALPCLAALLACEPPRDPDVNGDGLVDDLDVAFVSDCLGQDPAAVPLCAPADVDRDGLVSAADLQLVIDYRTPEVCNGSAALCDRPYDQVAYATTHNAMSNAEEMWVLPNQQYAIPRQLADGVRALMLDTHYDQPPGAPAPSAFLCHAFCVLGSKPLADGLAEIREFLDQNPGEVVTIIFESYISELDTLVAFVQSGLLYYAYAHTPGEPWPTLREMVARNRRLVVLTDDSSATLPWHHYVWSLAWETPFSASTPQDLVCTPNRGNPSNDLFILNHFLTLDVGLPGLAEQVNHDPFFVDRAFQCWNDSGRFPNFVTVDYYDIGDVLSVVDALNAAP